MKLDDVIQQPGQMERMQQETVLSRINVARPGIVLSYDEDEMTVDVQLAVRGLGEDEYPPILKGVPVVFIGSFTYDIVRGDECLVIFADGNVDAWWQTGNIANPLTGRKHDLSDGFALVGVHSHPNVDKETVNLSDLTVDVQGKADKVANATAGHIAGLDSNGNLTDSGSRPADFVSSKFLAQSSITDVNNTSLTGCCTLKGSVCANLPTNDDTWYQVMLLGYTQIAMKYSNSGTVATYFRYYTNNQWYPWKTGNADTASIFQDVSSTGSTGASTWNVVPSGSVKVWSQKFSDTSLKYTPSGGSPTTITDTGDFVWWLTPNATSNAATLCMRIDGTFQSTGFIGKLTGNADTATKLGTSTVGSSRQPVYLNAGAATTANYTVAHYGNPGKSNMNDVGKLHASSGMTNLTANTTDNPVNGTTGSSGWHLYWDTNYTDDPSGSNSWVAQIANKAGTDQWWVRSRSGGTITNGTAWASGWRHLATSAQAGVGGATTPVYVNGNGEVTACTAYGSASVNYATSAGSASSATNASALYVRSGSLVKGTNPSSTVWPGPTSFLYEKGSGTAVSNRIGGGIETSIQANGLTTLNLRAYQYASGSSNTNSLEIRIAKDGTCTYAVTSPANFRSAISAPSTTQLAYTTGSATATDRLVSASTYNAWYKQRCGDKYIVNMYFSIKRATNTCSAADNVLTGFPAPLHQLIFAGYKSGDVSKPYFFALETSGALHGIDSLSSSAIFMGTLTYITSS